MYCLSVEIQTSRVLFLFLILGGMFGRRMMIRILIYRSSVMGTASDKSAPVNLVTGALNECVKNGSTKENVLHQSRGTSNPNVPLTKEETIRLRKAYIRYEHSCELPPFTALVEGLKKYWRMGSVSYF